MAVKPSNLLSPAQQLLVSNLVTSRRPPRPIAAWSCIVALIFCASTGCVQRRLTVRSNPPGALVYIGNDEIGTTPVSTDYIYYGKRKFKLVKDGYETLSSTQWIPPPWYQIFPLDFFAENVVPYEIRDERTLDFQMQPQAIVPNEQLLTRAENLRVGSRTEGYTPPPRVDQPAGISAPNSPIFTPRFSQRDEGDTTTR